MTPNAPARLLHALNFAAHKHRDQRRKDAGASPYINHPIAVATVLAVEGHIADEHLLVAAVLHDTVEDTDTTIAELEDVFGPTVAELVRELTDDKSLSKDERKQHQVQHAPRASVAAKQLKIADKVCNLRDIVRNPPAHWPPERKQDYADWAERVVAGCRGVNAALDAIFDQAVAELRRTLGAVR